MTVYKLSKVLQSFRYGVAGQRVAKHVTVEQNQEAGVVLHIVSASNRKIKLKLKLARSVTVSYVKKTDLK